MLVYQRLEFIWLVFFRHPSEKWWSESQLGWWHSQLNGTQNSMVPVTTGQPVMIWYSKMVAFAIQPCRLGSIQAWHYHPMTHGEFTLSSPWAPLLESRHALNHPVTSTESTSRARAKSSPKDIPRNGRKNPPRNMANKHVNNKVLNRSKGWAVELM
jgi:hypothetical protein